MKKNRTYKVNAILMMLLAGTLSFSATAAASLSGLLPEAAAQQQLVKGTIVDVNGNPIPGASVMVPGTTTGTVTQIDGTFSLNVAEGTKVEIGCLGYTTVTTTARNGMKVVLKEDAMMLSDVVVVGYGTQKKANLTGAVSTVDVGKTLEGRPIADVGRGLQGSTPGLTITVPTGEVGTDPTINIRGLLGSTSGGASPLILLDNVEIPSLSLVNPEDIESISVLKDAASSSIYGAKAAFGVILITTKKGTVDDAVNVSYQGSVSFQNIAKQYKMAGLNGLEYSLAAAERAGGNVIGAFVQMTSESIDAARKWDQNYGGKLGTNDPWVYGRDWYVDANNRKIGLRTFDPYDYMVREWAPANKHSLSINGKSGSTRFSIGLGYLDQNGMSKVAKHDDFRRWNASAKVSTDVSKWLTVRTGLMYSKRMKRYANTFAGNIDPWYYMYRWGPNMPFGYDEFGNEVRSPELEMRNANTAENINNYTSANVGTTLNLTKDWHVNLDYTYANNESIVNLPGTRFSGGETWAAAVPYLDANGNRVYKNGNGDVVDASADGAMPAYMLQNVEYTAAGSGMDFIRRNTSNSRRTSLDITTDYHLVLGDSHDFKFLLGMNRVTYDMESSWSKRTNNMDITNPQFNFATGTQEVGGDRAWESQLGFFGRVNYSFKERYLLEANLRYDGTSKFPTNLKWRWFPSFSAGWRLGDEVFMEWAKPALTSLKLRGSWGTIGDQTVPNDLYVPTISTGTQSWLLPNGDKSSYASTPSTVSASITWQDITTLDFGFDARFFNSDLGITFDWYNRKTENMIVPGASVPATFGTGAPKANLGCLISKGFEIAIDYNHRFDNGLGINGMFTLSDAKTIIDKYDSNVKGINSWYEGKVYGEIWGYETDRLYQKDDFVYENGNLVQVWVLNGHEVAEGTKGAKKMNKLSDPNGVYQDFFQSDNFVFGPGDVKYKDLNGDGDIRNGNGTIEDPGDMKVIGNSTPRFLYGLRLGADWKGFDLAIFLQGVGKRDLWGSGSLSIPGFNTGDGAIADTFASDYWTENNTGAFYARPYNMSNSNDAYNYHIQSKYLLNMAYLRVKNITVGYTLPSNLTRKAYLKNVRFYISLENFFTFDNLRGLPLDPEVATNANAYGLDTFNLERLGQGSPAFKTAAFGVQVNF